MRFFRACITYRVVQTLLIGILLAGIAQFADYAQAGLAPDQPPSDSTAIHVNGVRVANQVTGPTGTGFQLAPFEYYTQQGNGEPSQATNCGPASVAMAIKYGSALGLQPSPQQIREGYMGLNGGRRKKYTNTSDVENALNSVEAQWQEVTGAEGVWEAINRFHTVVVPVSMRRISLGEDVQLASNGTCPSSKKTYEFDGKLYCYSDARNVVSGNYRVWWNASHPEDGHFVLANGVLVDTDNTRYFYIYDPNVFGTSGSRYFYFGSDYLPKGKYRIWKYDDLSAALAANGNKAVEVEHNPAYPIPVRPPVLKMLPEPDGPDQTSDAIQFVAHESYPSGVSLAPGQVILKAWRIRNSGQTDIGLEYHLTQVGGPPVQLHGGTDIGSILGGNEASVIVYVKTPQRPGSYETVWRITDPQGVPIDGTLEFDFTVTGQPSTGADDAENLTSISTEYLAAGVGFQRVWRVRNTGSTTWGGGYQLVYVDGEQMGGPATTNVPATPPGQETNLSINLTAPSQVGEHTGYWQLRNPQGTYFGPRLSVRISVQPTGSHITVLSADPPSPSSASAVRFRVRSEGLPNFRAMRLKIDGGIVYELGAPEFYYTWNTGSYSAGEHNIVVEVADQTDTSWARPERRAMNYTLQGAPAPVNHAPNRPSPASPYDWYVYYSGNTAQLCASANGDPDGNPINSYYFDVYESAQTWNSGWVGSSCVTTGALGPYSYKWRVKVRDNQIKESEWSDSWHFTLVNPNLSISELYFQPQDPNSEVVKIRTCTTGQGVIGITMRVSVNDANDGSGNGTWHIIKEQGSPCFNDVDAPIWRTLEYGDGPHRVRSEAHGLQSGWNGAAVREEVYPLPHRRPDSTRLLAPVPSSGNTSESIYLNSRTVTFRWAPTLRASNYTLHVGLSPSPKDDAAPVFRQTFGSSVTQHTVTYAQDYPTLYWQVSTTNDVGSNASGDHRMGIDRTAATCAIQPLPATTYESVFQVSWGGADGVSGVESFDIQYLDSGRGAWSDWLAGVPVSKTYDLFTGQAGHSYSFHCRATDRAGNTVAYSGIADTTIKVDPTARPQAPWWNPSYASKRFVTILNNTPGANMPAGYPVKLHFDNNTTPTAADLYSASLSPNKCDDLRVVYNDGTELHRLIPVCTPSAIDIWFRTQIVISAGTSNATAHQLYSSNPAPGAVLNDPNQVWVPYREGDTAYLYFFQEGSGSTAYVPSGNGRDCSINPSVQWASAKFGYGLRFNRANAGDSRSLSCGPVAPLGAFTIEFWYLPEDNSDGRIVGALAGGGNGGGGNNWVLSDFEGRMRLDIWHCPSCGSSEVRSNARLRDSPYVNRWNHIAVSFNGGNEVRFYVNGNLDAVRTLNESGVNTYAPPLEIGSSEGIGQIKAGLGALRISGSAKTSFWYGGLADILTEPTIAVGSPVDPPVLGAADLSVSDVRTFPAPSGTVVETVIHNSGNLETRNGFYTDLYLNHIPTRTGDYQGSVRFWVNDPIQAGSTVTLTTVITDLTGLLVGNAVQPAGVTSEVSGTLFAQVDSTGAVSETNNADNIFSAGTAVCVAGSDVYEDDDTPAVAKTIAVDQSQAHNFRSLGDRDWVKFVAQAGKTYRIATADLGAAADTYLYLYDTDAATLLASNDDAGGSLASQIDWRAPVSGTYYALVQHWNPDAGGCSAGYSLGVAVLIPYRSYLPHLVRMP